MPAGAAARVVDAALVGLEHLDQQLDDAARRVELAALLALGAGELGEEVLVDAAEDVLRAALRVAEPDVADQVDELAEALLVERRAGVVLGQHALERGVVALDGDHGVVDELADGRLLGLGLEVRPARLRRHPEDVPARYSSGSSGSAPCARSASSLACCSSKASEMYLRKIRPRTTCLYSAASMLLRSASAACQSWASKPTVAPLALSAAFFGFGIRRSPYLPYPKSNDGNDARGFMRALGRGRQENGFIGRVSQLLSHLLSQPKIACIRGPPRRKPWRKHGVSRTPDCRKPCRESVASLSRSCRNTCRDSVAILHNPFIRRVYGCSGSAFGLRHTLLEEALPDRAAGCVGSRRAEPFHSPRSEFPLFPAGVPTASTWRGLSRYSRAITSGGSPACRVRSPRPFVSPAPRRRTRANRSGPSRGRARPEWPRRRRSGRGRSIR